MRTKPKDHNLLYRLLMNNLHLRHRSSGQCTPVLAWWGPKDNAEVEQTNFLLKNVWNTLCDCRANVSY